ncbi:MAG: Ig-like domain-containing protein [Christensenellales bacterium]|jgi:uncharacterized protein YjdB
MNILKKSLALFLTVLLVALSASAEIPLVQSAGAEAAGAQDALRGNAMQKKLVVKITLDKSRVTLYEGYEPCVLTKTLSPANPDCSDVRWISRNRRVATVSQDGVVTPVSPGTAWIVCRAMDGSGTYTTCKVTVKPVRIRKLTRSATIGMTVGVNNTQKLDLTTSPRGHEDRAEWTTANPRVATVAPDGTVTAQGYGRTRITARIGKSARSCTVTVKRLPVTRVRLNRSSATLYIGNTTRQLTHSLSPRNPDNPNVEWYSRNESIATVSSSGLVTPVSVGTTYVYCRALDGSGKTARCKIVSRAIRVKSVQLSEKKIALTLGEEHRLIPTVLPENASDKSVTWASSDAGIVSVDENGLLRANKYGTVTITCTTVSGKKKATCTVQCGAVYRALVVGESDYAHGSQYDLPICAFDVELVQKALGASTYDSVRFENENIRSKKDLTGAQLLAQLDDMANWGIAEGDVTVFYYSGHGSINIDGESCLVGTDYAPIPMSVLRQKLDRLPGTVVILLDSCFSGGMIDALPNATKASPVLKTALFNASVVQTFASTPGRKSAPSAMSGSKYQVLTACGADELSYCDDSKLSFGSFFTHFLTKGGGYSNIEGGVTRLFADTNADSAVTMNEMFAYAKPGVQNLLASYGSMYIQTVMMYPSNSEFVLFARN